MKNLILLNLFMFGCIKLYSQTVIGPCSRNDSKIHAIYLIDGYMVNQRTFTSLNIYPCQVVKIKLMNKRQLAVYNLSLSDSIRYYFVKTRLVFQYKNKFYLTSYAKKKLAASFNDNLNIEILTRNSTMFSKKNRIMFKYGILLIGQENKAEYTDINYRNFFRKRLFRNFYL